MSFGLLGLICALMAVSAQQLVEVSNALDLKYAMVNPAVTQLKVSTLKLNPREKGTVFIMNQRFVYLRRNIKVPAIMFVQFNDH